MRPDILLSHGYFLAEDAHEAKVMKPYTPLGLLYVSAWLKRAGFGVEVLDSTFTERRVLEQRLDERHAPVLGLYTNLITRANVLDLTARAKAAGWHVVLGGPESANYPDAYLAAGADVIVFGEGEVTLEELLPRLAADGPHRLHGLAGVAFNDETGQLVRGPARAKLRDLDAMPWPDRAAVDIPRYLETWRTHHGAGSLNLITARGCPYKCHWCSHAVFGYSHARRSPAGVADEVADLIERYDPDQLWYADDVFTMSHRWLAQYTALATSRGLVRPFECITRADRINPEVVENLRRLGCYRVWLGSESGSQRILDAMERGVTVGEVQAATAMCRAAGLEVGMFLMWGYDGEEAADIAATIDHVKRSNPDIFLTTVAYPIKGTPYFDEVAERVVAPADWSAASDRDYRIRGRHSKRYYTFATRRLKHEVALHRLVAAREWRPGPVLRAAAGTVASRVGMRLAAGEVEAG